MSRWCTDARFACHCRCNAIVPCLRPRLAIVSRPFTFELIPERHGNMKKKIHAAHSLIHILRKSKLFKLTLIINRVTFPFSFYGVDFALATFLVQVILLRVLPLSLCLSLSVRFFSYILFTSFSRFRYPFLSHTILCSSLLHLLAFHIYS